ncbi:MAG: URC4/urg3 family protein [Alphaproteobacteria bacterium]
MTLSPPSPADYLLTAAAVRERCGLVFAAAQRGETRHFALDLDRMDEAAARVASATRRRYPDLAVPFHSRWRHFSAGGVDRAILVAPGADPAETARARLDLAIVSVLLDAGAGPKWRYREAATGQVLERSEGLAVASLRAMQAGLFSADPGRPWRADAAALAALPAAKLGDAFQHSRETPLAGLEGRAALLRSLGAVATTRPDLFGAPPRLGNLYDLWLAQRDDLPAPDMLRLVLRAFGPIWPGRLAQGGVPLGDCGRHPAVPGDGFVPFHKLSQWLVYSLIEPLADAGFTVIAIDGLTGLAEYRNGGLFIDTGIIVPRDPGLPRRTLDPFSEEIVEWRALTIALLDRLAERVRQRLGLTASAFPLARVLEGGSWAAGRAIAAERRPGGAPPLSILSDGTVF